MSALSGALLLLGGLFFFRPLPPPLEELQNWLWAASAVAGLWFVAPNAWRSARMLRPDMNLLMTVAAIGAGFLGDWFEAASTACLFSFALFLETWSVGHARKSIQAMLEIRPKTARVVSQDFASLGREVEMPVEAVAPGSLLVVRPGEAIPLDGVVERGETQVNEAPLTGESVPVFKEPGAAVYAGTVNGDGVIRVKSSKQATDTTISRIMRMVQEAQSRRAAVARWVDRFAAVYTPIMMLFCLLTAVVPPLAGYGAFSEWIMRGLVVLVTACPCALAISTPVTIVAGLTAAVRRGVLIKGGVYLELAARLDAVAFDKTGTLTSAALRVAEALPAPGRTREELLNLALALEATTTHPVGKAVHAFAQAQGASGPSVDSAANLPGLGLRAELGGKTYYAGSPRLFERIMGKPFTDDLLEHPLAGGDLPQALVFTERELVGAFFLEDATRTESRRTVRMLRKLGVGHVAMLTGDARREAEKVGALAGVDGVHAGLMPEEKVERVRQLRERYGRVAMVGDGVNDAPALASADLGIAMGAIGTGAAIETADITLLSDDISKLPWLIAHSRRTLAVVRQNIVFSLGVKALFILLALAGTATLWMAVVADVGTSLLVIANGLRLLGAGPGAVSEAEAD